MSRNDITGDSMASKPLSKEGRDQFDIIFGASFCKGCDYRNDPSGVGYCYMFKLKPAMPCLSFKESQ